MKKQYVNAHCPTLTMEAVLAAVLALHVLLQLGLRVRLAVLRQHIEVLAADVAERELVLLAHVVAQRTERSEGPRLASEIQRVYLANI